MAYAADVDLGTELPYGVCYKDKGVKAGSTTQPAGNYFHDETILMLCCRNQACPVHPRHAMYKRCSPWPPPLEPAVGPAQKRAAGPGRKTVQCGAVLQQLYTALTTAACGERSGNFPLELC